MMCEGSKRRGKVRLDEGRCGAGCGVVRLLRGLFGLRCRSRLATFRRKEEVPMSTATIREEAHRLVEQLPDDATWEDLLYQIYVRQSIEAGLAVWRTARPVA